MNEYSIYHWMGAGWYAPRQENGGTNYYWCGDNIHEEPDTYPMGLGTPRWLDVPPPPHVNVEVKRPVHP